MSKSVQYTLSMVFVDGFGVTVTVTDDMIEKILRYLKQYDHEGATWSVTKTEDVTEEIAVLYGRR